MYRLLYILRHTFLVLKETKRIAFITIISLLVGMIALGSTYIVGLKLFQSSLSLKEKVKIVVFFKQGLSFQDISNTTSAISSIEGVRGLKVTTPDEAKNEFTEAFPSI